MPERTWQLYLRDISDSINKIIEYSKDITEVELFSNDLILDAILRNLQVIGEATKKIPNEIKKNSKSIEWKKIAGLRDIIVHDYFGLDEDIISDIVFNEIPELKIEIQNNFSEIL